MRRRATWLLSLTALCLAAATGGLALYLAHSATKAAGDLLLQRLSAIGSTAARLLTVSPPTNQALSDLASTNELDGLYAIDSDFQLILDSRGHAGQRVNLLKLDLDRIRDALAGQASVGWAYDVDQERFLGGYFPFLQGGRASVLIVEAGARFTAPYRHLKAATLAAVAGSLGLSAVALVSLLFAASAAAREREASILAERAQVTSRMAAMVAHEVRNPLGIIRGGAELLREHMHTSKDRELCEDILEEVVRLNRLTEELLELHREGALEIAPLELTLLLREVCEGVALRFREKAPHIQIERATGILVSCDAAKLRQALLNLLINAVEAVEGPSDILIETRADRGGVGIYISDGGPGVPPALRERLFDPFTTGKRGGNGLGLAVARRIAERHGGHLSLVPSEKGARFELWLPKEPTIQAGLGFPQVSNVKG
jgi:two-component system OmpR family sensor kinase